MALPARLLDLDSDVIEQGPELGPAPYPRSDTEDPSKYATYSRAFLDEARASMEQQFIVWTQNLLFLAGLQWWSYDRITGALAPTRGPSWKEKPVRNILVPYAKYVMAKLTKNRPRTSCVPASTDPDDIHSAQLGDDVLRGKWHELRMSRMLRRALAWLIATGNSWIFPYWNRESGILMPLTTLVQAGKFDEHGVMMGAEVVECPCDEAGEPLLTEDGAYDMEAEPAYVDIGEVGFRVLSPFQVFPNAGAECDEDVYAYVVVESLTIREIYRRWPNLEEQVVAEDTSDIDRFDSLVSGLEGGADTHLAGVAYARDQQTPKALVIHYYEKQSGAFPRGRHWVSVNTQLCEQPGPLPDGIWPVGVHLKEIEIPGRFHADATLTHVVGLQREYNEINAQIKEHHNVLLRGKWLVPIGSNIRRGQITAEPGEVIQHTPGLPPKMAELRPLPNAVYAERERVLQDFQFITSAHSISMGKPPEGVTSGRAFLVLQEADDSDLGPLVEMLEEAVAELGWLTLQIIQEFYEEDRLVRISGENNRYRVRAFKGADLKSIVDVEPQAGSAFPWSKSAKQSMMIDLVTAVPALFQDPETGQFDNERFRRMLPVGGEEAVGLESDLDVAEALREEEEFEMWDGSLDPTGRPLLPMPLPWQNHQIHLRQHARVLKSVAFQNWEPENQQAFVAHWMATSAELAAQMQAMVDAEEDEEVDGDSGPAGPGRESKNRGGGGHPDELSAAERDPTT